MKYLLEISVDGILVKLMLEEMGYTNRETVEKVAEKLKQKLGGEYYSLYAQEEL